MHGSIRNLFVGVSQTTAKTRQKKPYCALNLQNVALSNLEFRVALYDLVDLRSTTTLQEGTQKERKQATAGTRNTRTQDEDHGEHSDQQATGTGRGFDQPPLKTSHS
jgi:hypothetical protein